jgi:hypothetical protein
VVNYGPEIGHMDYSGKLLAGVQRKKQLVYEVLNK